METHKLVSKYSAITVTAPEKSQTISRHTELASESKIIRLLVVPGLFVTTIVALLLLLQIPSQWRGSQQLTQLVADNRATTALVVQVFASLLGIAQLFTIRTTIGLTVRSYFARKPLSLGTIELLHAIEGTQLRWGLPWTKNVILLVWAVVVVGPAALWAGAITPIITSKAVTMDFVIPTISNISWIYWPQTGAPSTNSPYGFFTYKPEVPLVGLLLNAAASASYRQDGVFTQGKLDKTGYTYVNRSFGAGAAVGLADSQFARASLNYTYQETGLYTNVSCIYNATSNFKLAPVNSGINLDVFDAQGTLPHNVPGKVIIFAAAGYNDDDVVAVGTNANELNYDYHYVGFAVGGNGTGQYAALQQVQCEAVYTPQVFSVMVNTSTYSRTISVTPVNDTAQGPMLDRDRKYGLEWKTMDVITSLGATLASTLGTSVFADAFMTNIANAEMTRGKSNATNLRAIEDSLTSLIDNSITALLSAQLMLLNDTVPTTASVEYPSVVFGTSIYIIAIFAVNLVVILVYLSEVVRTWHSIPAFDLINIGNIITAASGGGRGVFDAASALSRAQRTGAEEGSYSRMVARLPVILSSNTRTGDPIIGLDPSYRKRKHGTPISLPLTPYPNLGWNEDS